MDSLEATSGLDAVSIPTDESGQARVVSDAQLLALARRDARRASKEHAAHGKLKGGSVLRLEAQLSANEQRTAALCQSLETLRRDAGPRCKEGAYAERSALLGGRKSMFLDARNVMNLNRGSGTSVVWPRGSKADERLKGHHHGPHGSRSASPVRPRSSRT